MHLPYVTLPMIELGAVGRALGVERLDWFAVFVFVGILAGVSFYDRIITRGGDVERRSARMLPEVAVAGGFVGAHLAHVLLYHPELMRDDPWVLLKVWAGISSMGGFVGGALAGAVALKRLRQPLVPYADRIALALSVAWIFGRLGCATSHDHPGRLTDFPLGVAYPDGVRHDLGLYELLFTAFVLVPLLMAVARRPWRTGTLAGLALASYGLARFGLDFLRATDRDFVDARYLGLTPAQYGTVLMVALGVTLLVSGRRRGWPMQPPLWGPPHWLRSPAR